MTPTFQSEVRPPGPPSAQAHWFVVGPEGLLVSSAGERPGLPGSGLGLPGPVHHLGRLQGVDCRSAAAPPGWAPPPGWAFLGLRTLASTLEPELLAVAFRAVQIAGWDLTHRFCGRCATPTLLAEAERVRRCPACELTAWPRLAPAVIMLVHRGPEVLLARGPRHPPGWFSTLAGFVEPGETLEEAVAREVREEVGVEVSAPRYFGSQPWPFPHSLMVGFWAEYASGELQVDGQEITEARWFTAGALPQLPPRLSISRWMIDAWSTGQPPPPEAVRSR